uniref:ZAD domain-containing protein n=1 Tax=Timema bartmani TaxID=61472 RepID=A0A7R9F3V3_9NEOP|nr:unnamed protein product [Timema bartmani]
MEGLENMDCGAVQAVERVGGAACKSAEERDKGRLTVGGATRQRQSIHPDSSHLRQHQLWAEVEEGPMPHHVAEAEGRDRTTSGPTQEPLPVPLSTLTASCHPFVLRLNAPIDGGRRESGISQLRGEEPTTCIHAFIYQNELAIMYPILPHVMPHLTPGLKKHKNDDLPSTCSTETSEPHLNTSETSPSPSPSTSTAEVAAAPPQKRPRLEVEVPPVEDEVEVIPTHVDLLDMTVEIVKSEPVECEPEAQSEESEPEKTNCRLCMYNEGSEHIFDDDVEENLLALKIIETLPSLRVEENDGFSQVVCVDCAMLVGSFYDFKLQCEKTDVTLRAATKKYQIPIKISRMKEERKASSACAEFKLFNIRIQDTLRTFYELMDSVKSFEEKLPSFGGRRSRPVRYLRSTSRGSKTRGFRGASKSPKRGSASTRRARRGCQRGRRGRRGASKMSDDALALNYSNTLSHNVHGTRAQVTGGESRIPKVSGTSSHSSNRASCVRIKMEVEDIQEPSSSYDSKEDVNNFTIPHFTTPEGLRGLKTYSRHIDNKQNISVTDTTGKVLSDDDIKNTNSTVTDDSGKVLPSNKINRSITSVTVDTDKVLACNKEDYGITSATDDTNKVPAGNKVDYSITSATEDTDKVPAGNKGDYRITSATDDTNKMPAGNKGDYRTTSATVDTDKIPTGNKGDYRITSVTEDTDKVPAGNKGDYKITSVTEDTDKVPAGNKGVYPIIGVTENTDKMLPSNEESGPSKSATS